MVLGNITAEPLSSVDPVFGILKEPHRISKTSRLLQLKHTLNSFKQEMKVVSTDQLLHYTVKI